MTGADKVVCQAATLLLLFTLTSTPAKAQFAGFGGGGELMSMVPQLTRIANVRGGRHGRRRGRR
ncbi:hypothetical protein [Bradyrhizobium australiense]|nr:hypothetical protein [Bradyrhizobium australiense]